MFIMSKLIKWFENPVRVIMLGTIMFFIATGVRAVYFVEPWYKFW